MISLSNLLRNPFYRIFLPVCLTGFIGPYAGGIYFDYRDNKREYNDLVAITEQVKQKAQGEGDFTPKEQINFLEGLGYKNLILMDEEKKLELWLRGLVGSNFKSPIAQPNGLFIEGIELANFEVSKGSVNKGIGRFFFRGGKTRTPPQSYVSMGENSLTFFDRIDLSKKDMEKYLSNKDNFIN